MRPGQNKRMRGRPNNNRRGPNPLTRSYESNGPDVKIRGNAHHVAEKYLQLARDAHTGGDPVAAENYLQHAEHYFRLIAAAQAAQALAQSGQRSEGDGEDIEDDEDFGGPSDRFASPSERAAYQPQPAGFPSQPSAVANSPQPFLERPPFEADRPNQGERPPFQPRQDRQQGRFPDRNARPDRPFGERGEGFRDNRQNRDGPRRDFRPFREHGPAAAREGGADAGGPAPGLPSFITSAPRPTPPESEAAPQPTPNAPPVAPEAPEAGPAFGESSSPEGRFPGRGRRRRLRSPYGFNVAQADADVQERRPNVSDDTPANE